MRKELLNGTRCMWIVCLCLVLNGMIIVGCGGSSSDHSQTWKDTFPALWSTAYAAEGDEPNPADVTYSEFLQAVVDALKADETFRTEICPITPEELNALVARIAELETKLESVSVGDDINGYSAITFSGVNVYVNNGTDTTEGETNGTGNLIVGYNELREADNDRSGSHNIVTGMNNNYSSYSGIVTGEYNTISGAYSCITGGGYNTASGGFSSITGGIHNTASSVASSVTGGSYNTASNFAASVTGGNNNTASAYYSSVSGGDSNAASSDYSSVSGGGNNTASGASSSVSGGYQNTASGNLSSVSGGWTNTAVGVEASVSGGRNNAANGSFSSVSGGNTRNASGDDDWVAGGLSQDQ